MRGGAGRLLLFDSTCPYLTLPTSFCSDRDWQQYTQRYCDTFAVFNAQRYSNAQPDAVEQSDGNAHPVWVAIYYCHAVVHSDCLEHW